MKLKVELYFINIDTYLGSTYTSNNPKKKVNGYAAKQIPKSLHLQGATLGSRCLLTLPIHEPAHMHGIVEVRNEVRINERINGYMFWKA